MKTTIITLPISRYDWKFVPALTKSGKESKTRKQWKLVKVADEQTFQGFIIRQGTDNVEVFVPTADMESQFYTIGRIFTKKGIQITAFWKHGRYGALTHEEPALFDWEKEELVSKAIYCDGRFKDSYKYLMNVNI